MHTVYAGVGWIKESRVKSEPFCHKCGGRFKALGDKPLAEMLSTLDEGQRALVQLLVPSLQEKIETLDICIVARTDAV